MADQDTSNVVTATAPEVTATTPTPAPTPVTPDPAPAAASATPAPDVTVAPVVPPAHTALATGATSVTDYITTEIAKHKELLGIVDSLKNHVDGLHKELNTCAGDILTQIKTEIKTPNSHKIIIGVVALLAIAIVVKQFI